MPEKSANVPVRPVYLLISVNKVVDRRIVG